LQLGPFESNANWANKRAEIESLNLPPIKVASHFFQYFGLTAAGSDVDWEQTAKLFRWLHVVELITDEGVRL